MILKCSNLVWEWSWDILQVIRFWGQKVKGQGHRVTKCKKAIEWPTWVMHSIECLPLVIYKRRFSDRIQTDERNGERRRGNHVSDDHLQHAHRQQYRNRCNTNTLPVSGGAVWWTLTRWSQVWCVCSVKTVWSIPDRFRGELLTMGRYTNLCTASCHKLSNKLKCCVKTGCAQRFKKLLYVSQT